LENFSDTLCLQIERSGKVPLRWLDQGYKMKMGEGPMPTVADPAERAVLIRHAFRLEWLSIAWMVIEGAVAIGAGIIAHSLLLVAFGVKECREAWEGDDCCQCSGTAL
jgi:hypothetical protein